MSESYYIEAALDLGIIQNNDSSNEFISYGISEDKLYITFNSGLTEITPEIISRARYLEKLYEIRLVRNSFLSNTDWIALSDVSIEPSEKQIWLDYRQALRDCTSLLVEGDESNFRFPEFPAA